MQTQLDNESLKLLARASIANSYFAVESGKHPYFTIYLQLLYKNQFAPLPGLFIDLLGWLTRDLPANSYRRPRSFDNRYQNQMINILFNSKNFVDIKELGRSLRDEDRKAFLILCSQLFFEKIAPALPCIISPGLMREVCSEPLELENAAEAVESRDDLLSLLDPEPWINEFRKKQPIFLEEDLRELRVVRTIRNDAQRIALKQCWKAQAWLEQHLKLKVKRRMLETQDVEIPEAMLAGTFPMGGIAGITNRGNLNTILPSELLYSTIKDPVDLFQVKFVENDLLYYLRDQQQRDEFERKLKIVIEHRDQFPDPLTKTNFSIHPFFLFSIIVSWIKYLPKFIPAIHFFIDIEMETPNSRSEEFFQILSVLTETFQFKGKVSVKRSNSSAKSDQTYHCELKLGTMEGGCIQMDWDGLNLFLGFNESTYLLSSDETGLFSWVEAGLYLLAGVNPPKKNLGKNYESQF